MVVYRILLAEFADRLYASGNANRWNSKGNFVIYTAASRALACLEYAVHTSGKALESDYRVLVIGVPDSLAIEEVPMGQLPEDWYLFAQYPVCQPLGDRWYQARNSPILRVPSAVIPEEFNYILNTTHPDFAQIKIIRREEFVFDPRIKQV